MEEDIDLKDLRIHLKVFRRRRPEERWIIFIIAGRREYERLGLDGRRRVGQAGNFPPHQTPLFSPRACTCTPPPPPTHSTTSEHDIACPQFRAPPPCHTFGRGEANCKGNARVPPAKGDRSVQCRSFYQLLACSQASVLSRGLRVLRV